MASIAVVPAYSEGKGHTRKARSLTTAGPERPPRIAAPLPAHSGILDFIKKGAVPASSPKTGDERVPHAAQRLRHARAQSSASVLATASSTSSSTSDLSPSAQEGNPTAILGVFAVIGGASNLSQSAPASPMTPPVHKPGFFKRLSNRFFGPKGTNQETDGEDPADTLESKVSGDTQVAPLQTTGLNPKVLRRLDKLTKSTSDVRLSHSVASAGLGAEHECYAPDLDGCVEGRRD